MTLCYIKPQKDSPLGARRVATRFQFAASCCQFCQNGWGTDPVLLDPGKEILHQVTPLEACLRRALWSLRAVLGDAYRCSTGIQHCGQPIVVKCLVGQRDTKRRLVAQWRYSLAVVDLFRKQEEANESAQLVHHCHHLCGQLTTGSANGLMLGSPPFCARSPLVNRDNGAVDEHHRLQIGIAAEDLESPRKHPAVYPSSEAAELAVPLAKARGSPRGASGPPPEHGLWKQTVVPCGKARIMILPMVNPFVHRP